MILNGDQTVFQNEYSRMGGNIITQASLDL